MANYPQRSFEKRLSRIRHGRCDETESSTFPVIGGAVRVTRKWFIMFEVSSDSKGSREWSLHRLANIVYCMAGIGMGCLFVWVEISGAGKVDLGRTWWIYLLVFLGTVVAIHTNKYRAPYPRDGFGQGNAEIALSDIKKVSLIHGIPLLCWSRIIVHYVDDEGQHKTLPIMVEGSFSDTTSQAAKAAEALQRTGIRRA